jgi:uncharacterized protein (TIGR00255 family)
VTMRIDRAGASEYQLRPDVLGGYVQQLEQLSKKWKLERPLAIEALLALPGVVDSDSRQPVDVAAEWPLARDTLLEAMERMAQMRTDEGRAMAADLAANAAAIAKALDAIESRSPQVADGYRARLTERITKTLAEYEITLQPGDLIREISIYAERSDISEEIVRLRSHLEQFATTLEREESAGRKLEFLTQEMFRETNTIGSKANDVEISRHVIEIKAAIERIREMIQNVE